MDPEPHAPTGPQKPLDEAIAEYLMACEVESKSPRTVQAYDETLRVFGRIVDGADLPQDRQRVHRRACLPVSQGHRR